MKEVYDVIIIGAGVTGLSIAYYLSKKDIDVLVIEKEPEIGFGVTKGHAAVIHVIQLPFNSLKSRLARKGNKMYDEICKELNVKIDRIPALIVATDLLHYILTPFIYLYLKYKIGKEYPIRLILRRKMLKKLESNINQGVKSGILVDGYAVIDAFDLVYSLYRFSLDNDVDFVFNTKIDRIEFKKDYINVYSGEKLFKGRFVINAAGLYADEIASYVGDKIKFEYGRGAMIIYKENASRTLLAPIYLRPDPKTKGGGIIPTVDDKSIWGPNLAMTLSKEDLFVREDDLHVLIEKFSPILAKPPENIVKAYSGIRPIPEGDDFIIDYSSRDNRLIHVAGIESPGLTSSPAIAEKICRLLEDVGLKLVNKIRIKYSKITYAKEFLNKGFQLEDGDYIICPCSLVSRNDVKKAVLNGAVTLQGLIFRTKLGFDECQFTPCIWKAIKTLAEELNISPDKLTLRGGDSWLVKKY